MDHEEFAYNARDVDSVIPESGRSFEEVMATHPVFCLENLWTEEHGGLQSTWVARESDTAE